MTVPIGKWAAIYPARFPKVKPQQQCDKLAPTFHASVQNSQRAPIHFQRRLFLLEGKPVNEMLRPPSRWRRLLRSEVTYDVPLAVCGCVAGVVASFKFFTDNPPNKWAGGSLALVACVSLILGISKALMKHQKQSQVESPKPLDAVLHTVHSLLTNGPSAAKKEHGLRICVFVPIPNDPEHVHQLTNYVGTATEHGAGKKISCRSGIVGEALRSNRLAYSLLPKGQSLVEFLVRDFGFTKDEAMNVRENSKSWAGIPVASDGKVVAVIFADSTDKDFWNATRRRIIEASAIGVAEYLTRS